MYLEIIISSSLYHVKLLCQWWISDGKNILHVKTLFKTSLFKDQAGLFEIRSKAHTHSLPLHLKDADMSYSEFRRSLKTFLLGQWGHGAVWIALVAPTRNILTYLLTPPTLTRLNCRVESRWQCVLGITVVVSAENTMEVYTDVVIVVIIVMQHHSA